MEYCIEKEREDLLKSTTYINLDEHDILNIQPERLIWWYWICEVESTFSEYEVFIRLTIRYIQILNEKFKTPDIQPPVIVQANTITRANGRIEYTLGVVLL